MRLVGDDQRTAVFRYFRLCAGGDCLSQAPPSWTGSEIGRRDWIWFGLGAVAGLTAGWSWSGNRRILPFLDECGLRSLPDRLFPWTDSEIGHRYRIRAEGNIGISVCPAVRPAGHHQRTMMFRLSWLARFAGTRGGGRPDGPVRESDAGIGSGPRASGVAVGMPYVWIAGFGACRRRYHGVPDVDWNQPCVIPGTACAPRARSRWPVCRWL